MQGPIELEPWNRDSVISHHVPIALRIALGRACDVEGTTGSTEIMPWVS